MVRHGDWGNRSVPRSRRMGRHACVWLCAKISTPRRLDGASPIHQSRLERCPQIVWNDGHMKVSAPVPAQGPGANADHYFLRFGRITKWSLSPPISLTQDLRSHSQARHRCLRSQSDQRATSFACGAGKSHRLGALGLQASDHDQRKPSAAEKLLSSTKSVLPIAWTHEDWAFFPEWTGDGAQSVDPDRSLALGDGGVTRGSKDGGRPTLRHPDCESSARQASSGQNRIDRFDPRCHRLRGPMGDRCRIWKSMLDEGANGGIAIEHSFARISRTYPESKRGTRAQAQEIPTVV